MIEAVYFADPAGSLAFEYLSRFSSPHFHVLSTIISKGSHDEQLPFFKINSEFYLYFQALENLTVYLLQKVSKNGYENPLEPVVFLERLVSVMESFFGGPLSVTKIDANNDTLVGILNEMVGAEGVPQITDLNQIRELVPFKSLLLKILDNVGTDLTPKLAGSVAAAGGPNHHLVKQKQKFAAETDTPWRKANVKYTTNEMFVDIVEQLNVIFLPKSPNRFNGKHSGRLDLGSGSYSAGQFYGTIDGRIEFTSHLTGQPDLRLSLQTFGVKFQSPALHKCVRMDSFTGNLLSFIPPDGKSNLLKYQIDVDSSKLGLVTLELTTGLGAKHNEFEIRMFIANHTATKTIENIAVKVYVPGSVEDIKQLRITHGEWSQLPGAGASTGSSRPSSSVGEWTIRSVSTGTQPLLRGILLDNNTDTEEPTDPESPLAPDYCTLSYNCKGSLPLGIKVDYLKIASLRGLGESVKPYKGVKYLTKTGDYVVRL